MENGVEVHEVVEQIEVVTEDKKKGHRLIAWIGLAITVQTVLLGGVVSYAKSSFGSDEALKQVGVVATQQREDASSLRQRQDAFEQSVGGRLDQIWTKMDQLHSQLDDIELHLMELHRGEPLKGHHR